MMQVAPSGGCFSLVRLAIAAAAAAAVACHDDSASMPTAGRPNVAAPDRTPPPVAVSAAPVAAAPRAPDVVEVPDQPYARQPSAACLSRTGDAREPRATSIHRWVDAAGVTHYSDRAPSSAVSGHRVLEVKGLPPVTVEASGYDVNLPADVQRRAVVDTLAVQRAFRDTLGIDGPATISLRIVFVGNADAYARLVGDRVLAASAGAYVPQQHTIYVRMQADDERAFSILRHEITHALIHEWVGNLPVPLNEGLAEYFRHYKVAGMGGQVDIAADRAALVGAAPEADGSDALVELLGLDGADFYAADRERRYERAYGLVALLLRDAPSTEALHAVLVRQRAEPCAPVRVEQVLDERYPGGLQALADDWAAFLHDPPASVRAY